MLENLFDRRIKFLFSHIVFHVVDVPTTENYIVDGVPLRWVSPIDANSVSASIQSKLSSAIEALPVLIFKQLKKIILSYFARNSTLFSVSPHCAREIGKAGRETFSIGATASCSVALNTFSAKSGACGIPSAISKLRYREFSITSWANFRRWNRVGIPSMPVLSANATGPLDGRLGSCMIYSIVTVSTADFAFIFHGFIIPQSNVKERLTVA
jgi:hypothetical protein